MLGIDKQLGEFNALLQDMSRQLAEIVQLLQQIRDGGTSSVTIIGDRDGWHEFKEVMTWTGQETDGD